MAKHTVKNKKCGEPLRAALYTRVSTGEQAKRSLSVPDQRRQLKEYCDSQDWLVVSEFTDASTGTDEKRPGFQRMMDLALQGNSPFDVILVHTYSRFFRDEIELEIRIRALAKRGVELISVTQPFEDDPLAQMVRRIMALFDEYDSKETGKHVSRSMAENARQGFFSGGVPPFGFRAVVAEERSKTIKKKLVPREDEADVVRLVFDTYLRGDGTSGPMGVKKVTEWLNDHGYRTRNGARWGIGPIHKLLTNPIHIGNYLRRGGSVEADRVLISVPPIVSSEVFDAVQRRLKTNNVRKTPARVVSGPILLTGLATCASCGNGMTLSTGKGGKYQYYACSGRGRQGKGTCVGRRIRMGETDQLVLAVILENFLNHERMAKTLQALSDRQVAQDDKRNESVARHEERLNEVKAKLARILKLVEDGVMESSDPDLAERIEGLRTERDIAQTAVKSALAQISLNTTLSDEKIEAFIELLRKKLTEGDVKLRRAYLRAVVSTIEIDKTEIRIHRQSKKGGTTPFAIRNGSNCTEATAVWRIPLSDHLKAATHRH